MNEKRNRIGQTSTKIAKEMKDLSGVEIILAQWIQHKMQVLKRKKRNRFKALLKKSLRQHGEAECPKTQADLEDLILKWKRELIPATPKQMRAGKKALKSSRRKVNGFVARQSSKSKYNSKGAGRGRKQNKEDYGVKRSARGFRTSKIADDFMLGGFM